MGIWTPTTILPEVCTASAVHTSLTNVCRTTSRRAQRRKLHPYSLDLRVPGAGGGGRRSSNGGIHVNSFCNAGLSRTLIGA
ncbi:MAG: hypothetical protein A3H64_00420 [Candidatus Ryanbacteria bacterium RIFCSPLOWO2_02_FULL_45_11c]|uniref:Uncharacterized protein n=1 Tax=Candidatus Ryanbacteria bacterium RIFCSPLOWO2_02_FULL_45_11c TaxID=1802128 RepID=A0A1G2GVE3_9BACT|nr:MAG: hypothetical protein A3H64_00420 [Candidatus Ryanbacteria bacterium RIFCSPLOWO2_02_FULL_45_11c]